MEQSDLEQSVTNELTELPVTKFYPMDILKINYQKLHVNVNNVCIRLEIRKSLKWLVTEGKIRNYC